MSASNSFVFVPEATRQIAFIAECVFERKMSTARDPAMKIADAAHELGYSTHMVRRWIKSGKLKAVGRGKLTRVRLSELRRFQEAITTESAAAGHDGRADVRL